MKKYKFLLKNLDCAMCAQKIQDHVSKREEFHNVVVNFSKLTLSLETEEESGVKSKLKKIIQSVEPEVEVLEMDEQPNNQNFIKKAVIRLGIGVFLGIMGILLQCIPLISTILMIASYIVLLWRTAKTAYKILKTSKTINENFLVTVSCVGAYLIGEHIEGLMVILLYEIGKILEDKAVNNTRKSIQELMDIKPEYANIKIDGEYQKVNPEELKIGDIILVKQGEKIPLDGKVIKGNSKLDMSALTGESELKEVKEKDLVLSGSINLERVLEIEVTCEYENSTVYKILELVENATDKKAKTETFVARLSRIYTPTVFILAILVALFLPFFVDITYSESIYRSLIFLVISCPCAIAISVPLSYFSGIGASSKKGILMKGSDYLDALKEVTMIVFDKTGTLTTGSFEVKKVESYDEDYQESDVIKLMAKGEKLSNHPIAKSILNFYHDELTTEDVSNYEEVSGKGIKYSLSGKQIKVGNASFCGYRETENDELTKIYLSIDNKTIGSVSISDGMKEKVKETIQKLQSMGIQTAMFTGDNKEVADAIAKKLNLNEVKAELLPTDKYNELEKVIKENKNGKIAFVGDGINDAPVLARSDIGISMGNLGSSSAIEASDIVIMTDELEKIPVAIQISSFTRKIIKQNLVFALSTKLFILLLSVVGIAGMWQAIFADVGVTLITILNTTRILKMK